MHKTEACCRHIFFFNNSNTLNQRPHEAYELLIKLTITLNLLNRINCTQTIFDQGYSYIPDIHKIADYQA